MRHNKFEKMIIKDYESDISIDVIIGRYINKNCDNKDDITRVIKDYRWDQWKKKGVKK